MSDRDAHVPELSPDADAAWRAFAGSIAPDEDAQARVLQRVRARTKAPRPAESNDVDEDANGSQNIRRAAAAMLVVKSSAITVGLAGGALLSIKLIAAAVHSPAAAPAIEIPEPPAVERRSEAAPTHAARLVPGAAASPTPPTSLQSPTPASPIERRTAPTPASPGKEDLLQAEIDLIGRIRDSLQAANYTRALALLETHRAGFPNGSFIEERDAFHAIAACRNGDANGTALAQRFATSRPHSSQLAAVRAACPASAIDAIDSETRQR